MAGDPAPLNGGLQTKDPIRFPVAQTLYVRKTGSDNNGGGTNATTPTVTGSDGVTDGSPKFTAASGAFDASYVDKLINIVGVGRFRIEAAPSATQLTLSAPVGPASAGSGKTWNIGGAVQTIGALLGNGNAAVREGDMIYVGAGTYRELITVGVAPRNGASNAAALVSVIGDSDGTKTGDAGMVQVTAYTTDDKTAPATAPLVVLNGQSFLSFAKLQFVTASQIVTTSGLTISAAASIAGAASQFISFTDCSFFRVGFAATAQQMFLVGTQPGVPFNWTIDRCNLLTYGNGGGIRIIFNSGVGGDDYDGKFTIKNSFMWQLPGSNFPAVTATSFATSAKGGGVVVRNCHIVGGVGIFTTTTGVISLTYPCVIYNSVMNSGINVALTGGTIGQLLEDYNLINAVTARSSVTAGTHSISDGSYAPLFHFGQELLWGGIVRPFGEPLVGSPLLGFGNDGSQSSYDARNQPRPAGGGNALPAIGALERGNTFAKETGTVHTGSNAISATGPAYQDFLVPVASGTAYTFSVYTNYDGSYTGTAPQLLLLNGTEAGVSDQTVTAGGSAGGGWTQITLAPFTPTANSFVTLRMYSRDTSGVSKVVFDSFAQS